MIFGLPGETRTSFRSSLNFGMSLDPTELCVFTLMVLPGTELWKSAETLRLDFEPAPPYRALSHMTMDAGDFAYGQRLADAAHTLAPWRAARLLARERGLTFADLADKWVAWDHSDDAVTDRDRVEQFVTRVCDEAEIPPDFYRHVIRLAADPPRAQRPPLP
ncbi:MAG TPA: hypothetical protein VNJ04_02705 [Gemmatimonadaceae bacterium]|nr:hypothetical protein [Gemmatimonadaceae bacterium]